MGVVQGNYRYQTPHYYDVTQGPLPGATLWERIGAFLRAYDPYPMVEYANDFAGVSPSSNTINGWTVTIATSGTITEDTTNPNGVLAISAGAVTANQGVNWQMTGSPYKIQANKPLAFEVKGQFSGLSTTPKVQFFAGVAEQTTALITSGAFATKDRVGIGGVSATGVLTGQNRGGGTAVTGTGVTIADVTDYRFGFFATSSQIDYYVNGAIVSSQTTQIPTGALAPIIVMQANATVTPVFNLDYIRVVGFRA